VSRIIRKFESIKSKIQKHIPLVSKIATFLIIFYIFSLQNIHGVFSQNIALLVKIFITVFVAYIGVFGLAYVIYRNQKNKSDFTKSFFWNSTIRFITLGIVFGVVYVPYL
jgi:predicted Na+-dependent transporter